jgi:hypothetical protein
MGRPPIDAAPAVTTSTFPAPRSATAPGIVPASTWRINSSRTAVLTWEIVRELLVIFGLPKAERGTVPNV